MISGRSPTLAAGSTAACRGRPTKRRAPPSSPMSPDEVRVAAWAEVREPLERQLAPLGRHALAALAPRPGESIVDIGCGGGETGVDPSPAGAAHGAGRGGGSAAAG